MKAQSYGKYDVFDDTEVQTWEQAEALALKARGEIIEVPEAQPQPQAPEATEPAARFKMPPVAEAEEWSADKKLLNKALILLIHMRERVFKEDPEIEGWVNELLTEARAGN